MDAVVPVAGSREPATALKDAGANVRYTEYLGLNHNSWDATYGSNEFVTCCSRSSGRSRGGQPHDGAKYGSSYCSRRARLLSHPSASSFITANASEAGTGLGAAPRMASRTKA